MSIKMSDKMSDKLSDKLLDNVSDIISGKVFGMRSFGLWVLNLGFSGFEFWGFEPFSFGFGIWVGFWVWFWGLGFWGCDLGIWGLRVLGVCAFELWVLNLGLGVVGV